MARQRDYHAEYERRKARSKTPYKERTEKAQREGWASYNQKRRAYEKVRGSRTEQYYIDTGFLDPTNKAQYDEAIKSLYEMRFEGDNDYTVDSWHYHLFVEVLHYYTHDEWLDAYPTGIRYGLFLG